EAPKKEGPASKPESLMKYPDKPQLQSKRLIILKRKFTIDLSTYAWAQDDLDREIVKEIKSMPNVLQAYRNRSARLNVINTMLSEGKAGVGNKGLLVGRSGLTMNEKAALNAENKDRETIIEGMAKAIVKINNIDPTPENIKRVIPNAGEQFAAATRSEAQSGWWVQLPDGSWVEK
ncbi:MAG: YdbL family protein, partial [Candidatus Dadabacteria bacterium]|nr:YdbL family protein [Candidatus Dadabacteria bacterium]